mmetsp:Transcript_34978/g.79026  ORF Transcript_34978/g.79026 Transcript_34978/m.79026 type:complete len:102 (+) Transcript_34978:84-389(+)
MALRAVLSRLHMLAPRLAMLPRRSVSQIRVDRQGDIDKTFGLLNKRMRDHGIIRKLKEKRHYIKGAEKAVKRQERKEFLKLKSKVGSLLEWVEFKQRYRVD